MIGRVALILVLGAVMGAPGSLHASIPPTYQVTIVAEGREGEAQSRALIEYMAAQEAFFWSRSNLPRRELQGCLAEEGQAQCIRDLLQANGASPAVRPVVILVNSLGENVEWRCIGSGLSVSDPAGSVARVDLQSAIFGEGDSRISNLKSAMDCIYAAAQESSPA